MSDGLVKRAKNTANQLEEWVQKYTGINKRSTEADLIRLLADRIEELEAKLAKAVGVLRFYGSICADKDKSPWNVYSEDFGKKARALIAEINGGGDT